MTTDHSPVEISGSGALCDDDYGFLGEPDPALAASWPHCSDIVTAADRNGFDNVLLPSGYTLGIDSTAFAAARHWSRPQSFSRSGNSVWMSAASFVSSM